MVFGLACVVDLLVVEVGVAREHSVDDGIVLLQRSKQIFFLHEVQPNGLVPVQLADSREECFILLSAEDLQSEEHEAD